MTEKNHVKFIFTSVRNFSVGAFPFVSLSIHKHAYPVWRRVKSADNPSKKHTVTSFLLYSLCSIRISNGSCHQKNIELQLRAHNSSGFLLYRQWTNGGNEYLTFLIYNKQGIYSMFMYGIHTPLYPNVSKENIVYPLYKQHVENACNKHIRIVSPTFFAVIQNFEDHCKL